MKSLDRKLLDKAIQHSKILLSEVGGFVPFAIIRDSNNKLRAYVVYPEDETDEINGNEIRRKLILLLDEDVKNGKIIDFIISTNVCVKNPESPMTIDAVELRYGTQEMMRPTFFLEYEIHEGEILYHDLYSK